jgi:hypothetical protein
MSNHKKECWLSGCRGVWPSPSSLEVEDRRFKFCHPDHKSLQRNSKDPNLRSIVLLTIDIFSISCCMQQGRSSKLGSPHKGSLMIEVQVTESKFDLAAHVHICDLSDKILYWLKQNGSGVWSYCVLVTLSEPWLEAVAIIGFELKLDEILVKLSCF